MPVMVLAGACGGDAVDSVDILALRKSLRVLTAIFRS